MTSSFPASYSGQSIISLNTTVPSSSSERSIISIGSTSYETCPSDSPPPPSSSSFTSRPYTSSSPSYYYEPPPPLPRLPYYNGGKGGVESLQGALQGMNFREEVVLERAQPPSHNKPLPRLPPSPHPPTFQSTSLDPSLITPPAREDPSSARYRAGSSFTTVYHLPPSPPPPTRPSSSFTASAGAAGLVLRRRENGAKEGYAGPNWNENGSGVGGRRVNEGRNDQAQHPHPSSSSTQLPSPTPSDQSHVSRPMPGRYLPSYQQNTYQPPPPHPTSPSTSSFRPPPPPPSAPHQQHVPFPSSYAPPPPPPPPPPFQHQPHTSPPSLPSQRPPNPHRFPSPRQPSFSALPPSSTPPSARPTQPSSPFSTSSASNTTTPRARAHSAVPLSSADGRVQCGGKTKTGRQCEKRKAKDASSSSSPKKRQQQQQAFLAALAGRERGYEDEEEEVWYCHLHKDAILKNTGVYVGGGGRLWVEFEDWIPRELKDETSIALMTLMEKNPSSSSSSSSETGFIYCFEYRGLSTPTYRVFKIGQSKNVASRLEQWGAQCPSKEPRLLGVVPSNEDVGGGGSRLRGLRGAGMEGSGVRGSLWFEKLVHLEVASFDPGIRQRDECVDCKRFHKEMFRIPRFTSGREFEDLVLPVMERWERFVRMVMEEQG